MKITDVEAIVVRQPALDSSIADGSQDDLIVRVHTDAGIIGIGEVDSAPEVVKAIIDAPASHAIATGLRHALLGEDPLDVERLWWKMFRATLYLGRRGAVIHAMSGIDIALWDIRGKALQKPVAELLGVPLRRQVRAYASALMPGSEAAVGETVHDLVDRGFTAIKLGWGPLGTDAAADVRLVAAARRAGGDSTAIMVDAGCGYGADVDRALRVAVELEQLGVAWLEEPFEPDEIDAYASLADAVDLPIACGEQDSTRWGFRDLIERGHVDILQPDVTRCGGLTEALEIVRLAEKADRVCVPHAWKSGIVKAASLHLNAVLPDARFQEYCVADTLINTSLTVQRFPIVDGFVQVPQEPGLGVDLDLEVLERLAVRRPVHLA